MRSLDLIVIHVPECKAPAHFRIDSNGTLEQLLHESVILRHAEGDNLFSLSVEVGCKSISLASLQTRFNIPRIKRHSCASNLELN